MSENLMDGLQAEIIRVKEIVKEYEQPDLKGAGRIAAYFMKIDIARSKKAIGEMDVVQMIYCYNSLKEYTL